jgi:BON domain
MHLPHVNEDREGVLEKLHLKQPKRRRGRWVMPVGGGILVGAVSMYFADPDRGKRRRKMTLDRGMAVARRGARRAGRMERLTLSTARGWGSRVAHFPVGSEPIANDQMLTDRVLSQAFRGQGIHSGQVNVNVEDGIVVLHGALKTPEEIRNLESAVRSVSGVRGVKSYLHQKNTPAPPEDEPRMSA